MNKFALLLTSTLLTSCPAAKTPETYDNCPGGEFRIIDPKLGEAYTACERVQDHSSPEEAMEVARTKAAVILSAAKCLETRKLAAPTEPIPQFIRDNVGYVGSTTGNKVQATVYQHAIHCGNGQELKADPI